MSKELIRIDASGKIPSRPKSTRRDPESRIALALEAGASQALPPVSELGFETALAAMADNSKAALAAANVSATGRQSPMLPSVS